MAFGNATKGYVKAHSGGGGSSGTTNYNNLSNKPSINGITLSGNKTSADLGIGGGGGFSITDVTSEISIDGISATDYSAVILAYKDSATPTQIATAIFPINEDMTGNLVINDGNGYLAVLATITDGTYKLITRGETSTLSIYKAYAI